MERYTPCKIIRPIHGNKPNPPPQTKWGEVAIYLSACVWSKKLGPEDGSAKPTACSLLHAIQEDWSQGNTAGHPGTRQGKHWQKERLSHPQLVHLHRDEGPRSWECEALKAEKDKGSWEQAESSEDGGALASAPRTAFIFLKKLTPV